MIKCITFDLDDTLWAVDPVIVEANNSMFSWLDQHAPEFTRCYQLRDLVKLRKTVLQAQPDIGYSVTRIRQAQLKHGMLQAGYTEADAQLLADQAFEVFLHARQQVTFFEHAREMLSTLRQQNYQLGALSNGNADIHKVGLADLIDFQFSADQIGSMKPDAAMFEAMLSYTQLKPQQVIHVGDNHQHDVEGAATLGIHTVWVNMQDSECSDTASATISCLSQLPSAVAEITRRL